MVYRIACHRLNGGHHRISASIRSTAMAAPTQADDPSSWAKTADGGGAQEVPIASNFPKAGGTSPFFQANSPSEETESAFSDSEAGFEAVWQANLTVGYATDSITTLLGYMPEVYGSDGALDLDSFSYDDQSFVIENLVFQQVLGGAMQLVLNANQRLPDDLVFQAKTQEYPIQESMALGLYNNIHIWRVDTPLDWTEGETFQVILWRVLDTGAQQSPQFVGPAPLHTLPDGTHVDGNDRSRGITGGRNNGQRPVQVLQADPRTRQEVSNRHAGSRHRGRLAVRSVDFRD